MNNQKSGIEIVRNLQKATPPKQWKCDFLDEDTLSFSVDCYPRAHKFTQSKSYITCRNHIVISDRKAPWLFRPKWEFEQTQEGGLCAIGKQGTDRIYTRMIHISDELTDNIDRKIGIIKNAIEDRKLIRIKGLVHTVKFEDPEVDEIAQFTGWDRGNQCPCVSIESILNI